MKTKLEGELSKLIGSTIFLWKHSLDWDLLLDSLSDAKIDVASTDSICKRDRTVL